MRAYERFLNYVRVHTTSDPANGDKRPSTDCQFDLANMLVEEMRGIGIADARVDGHCCVYGHIPASAGCEGAPALAFIAHMDTTPDAPGEGVRPILHENYDGGSITLPSGRVIDVAVFKELPALRGQTLITASGDTLLGADNKAGVAEIMAVCERVISGGLPHGPLCIGFTPDEEIGAGADDFDLKALGAQYGYTVDGGPVHEIMYECFNAAQADLEFRGVAVHPGGAKNIMVNAARLAIEYDALLPAQQRPEHTENREGYFNLTMLEGTVDAARSSYTIRDHDGESFERRKRLLRDAADWIARRYGEGSVKLAFKDSYRNMAEIIERNYHLIDNAKAALKAIGLKPVVVPIRGGTDGSRLSFMGLPCPNIGTGGMYNHGPNECITAEAMDKAVDMLAEIVRLYSVVPADR